MSITSVSLRRGQFELERRGDMAELVRYRDGRSTFEVWENIPWSVIEDLGVLICEVRELVEEKAR